MVNSKTFNYFLEIFSFLPKTRRKEFFALIPVALIAGISEIIVLSIVSRLFNFLSNQPRDSVPFLSNLFDFEPKYKILILISSFIFFSWFSSFLKLYVRAKQLKLKATIWRDLSELALKNILSQEYEFFIENTKIDSGCFNAGFENISILDIASDGAGKPPSLSALIRSI